MCYLGSVVGVSQIVKESYGPNLSFFFRSNDASKGHALDSLMHLIYFGLFIFVCILVSYYTSKNYGIPNIVGTSL